MQHKNIILISLLALSFAGTLTYYFSTQSSQSDDSKGVIPSLSSPVSSGSTGSGNSTLSDSSQGTEEDEKKSVPSQKKMRPSSIKIDTTWKTRTIVRDGVPITYVFGQGNPPEVALTPEQIEATSEADRINGAYYMYPEAELAMKEFLEDPNLPRIIEQCKEQINWDGSNRGLPRFTHKDFSLESILYIDPKTGRKEFRDDFFLSMSNLWSMYNPMYDWRPLCLAPEEYEQLDALGKKWEKLHIGVIPEHEHVMTPEEEQSMRYVDTSSPAPAGVFEGQQTPHDTDGSFGSQYR